MSQVNEHWDRRKWYLLRSLFTDSPLLSPIPETQEPTLYTPQQAETTLSRPDSTLPDLIIEKEPNRHDEPEEFYQALEKKVIKYYKKLFKDTEISSQIEADANNFLSLNDSRLNIDQSLDQDYSNPKYNGEVTNTPRERTFSESEEQEERSSEILEKNESTESLADFSTNSESQNNEIVVTKAVVHRARSEEMDDLPSNVTQASSSDTRKSSGSDVEDGSELFENLETECKDSSTSNNNHKVLSISDNRELLLKSSDLSDTSSSQEQPDIMRKQHLSNDSMDSIQALNDGRNCTRDVSADNNLEITSVREMEITEMTSPENSVILESGHISKIVKNKCEPQFENKKRRILSDSPSCRSTSSPKRPKFDNVTNQCSINLAEIREKKWQKIQQNLFEGSSRIFKLCSCINHDCS